MVDCSLLLGKILLNNRAEIVYEATNCSTTVGDEKGCKQHKNGSTKSKVNLNGLCILFYGWILNEVLKTEEWTEKVDAVVDSSKAVIGGELKNGRIHNEVLKTEEWAEKVDTVMDSSKAVIAGDL